MPRLNTRNVTGQSIALFLNLVALELADHPLLVPSMARNDCVARQPGGVEGYFQLRGDLCS